MAVSYCAKSAELGLTAVLVPEQYGGMEMDLRLGMIVAEGIAKDGSYAAWHGAHAGIGTLPLLLSAPKIRSSDTCRNSPAAKWSAPIACPNPCRLRRARREDAR